MRGKKDLGIFLDSGVTNSLWLQYGYKKVYATRCDVERVKCKILLP